jgi:hypothetical protein
VTDQQGGGYYLEPGQGQFGDDGRGDNPFVYAVLHHANEGDADLGVFGDCCLDDHQQGPDLFVNGEAIVNANIVLWYVPQMQTDAFADDGDGYYCWTIQGEPNPETYPCFAGPMFIPMGTLPPDASFSHNSPIELGQTAVFTNSTTGSEPITYTWDFGDGVGSSNEADPTYVYSSPGTYTITLTANNDVGTDIAEEVFVVYPPGDVPPEASFVHNGPITVGEAAVFMNTTTGTEPITYLWDFGDGVGTSGEISPTYDYAAAGVYTVTLIAENGAGTDIASSQFVVYPIEGPTNQVFAPVIQKP